MDSSCPRAAVVAMVGAVAAVLVSLPACGGPTELDMARARKAIASSLRDEYELAVTHLRCPDDVEVREGGSFRCRLDIGGQPLRVRVVQLDTDGDLRVEPAAAVLRMDRVRADLSTTLADQLAKDGVKVDCGAAKVKVVAPGGEFDCRVTDRASAKTVTVRVRDASGSLTYTIR